MTDLGPLGVLSEPVRRRLYEYVAERHDDVSRDEAAAALDLTRSTAAFHLDKLVEEGLLEASFKRLHGRTGPGAGRPSKLYRRTATEFSVALPPREYQLMAAILADAADQSGAGRNVEQAARRAGERVAASVAEQEGDLLDRLRALGYEPEVDDAGEIILRNCPFHALADQHRTLICGANLEFVSGVLDAIGSEGRQPRLDPEPGQCCVKISKAKKT